MVIKHGHRPLDDVVALEKAGLTKFVVPDKGKGFRISPYCNRAART